MKKIFSLLTLVICLSVNAQTADEIIKSYTNAMGGLKASDEIESIKIDGTLISQGKSYPLTIYVVNGKQMRTDVDVSGQKVVNAYDKGKGWKINPFEGLTTATEITTPDDLAQLKVQASIANNLMDYKSRGHQVEYLGQQTLGTVNTYKIKLVSKDDGKTTIYYIAVLDYMLIRSDSKQKIQNNEYDSETWYTNVQTIKGVKFATHFIRKIQGTVFQEVNYDKIELNVSIDDNIFKMPK